MASITFCVSDDLASQIRAQEQQLPRIPELGLTELNADAQAGFDGTAGVLELLAALPPPEKILKLRSSPRLSARIAELVEKSRAGEMTSSDRVSGTPGPDGKSRRTPEARAVTGRRLRLNVRGQAVESMRKIRLALGGCVHAR